MADEAKQGEMPEKPETAAPDAKSSETPEQLKAELETLRKALKEANREAADRRKKLDAIEEAENKRKEAELTEAQKLKKTLDETVNELATLKANELKRKVGAKHNLPEALAIRLQGATEEELDADAKQVLDALPKPAKPSPGPVNPGTGGSTKPTDAERLARAHGQQSQPWDIETFKKMGGGAHIPEGAKLGGS